MKESIVPQRKQPIKAMTVAMVTSLL